MDYDRSELSVIYRNLYKDTKNFSVGINKLDLEKFSFYYKNGENFEYIGNDESGYHSPVT